MFKSVGEASPFSEDRDDYGYEEETHRNSALSGNNDRHNNHHHHEGVDDDQYNPFNQPSPPQFDSDDNTEQPMSWKKMHWHASRIDKVQDLVPEQVRYGKWWSIFILIDKHQITDNITLLISI